MLCFFNYSMKKFSNLEWSFSIIDTSWKNKTPIVWTKIFRMMIYLSKNFLQNQSFFIVGNQRQMLFVLLKTGWREWKLLNFKRSSKTFTQDTKAISNYIYLLYLLFPFNPFIPTDWHQQEPLCWSEFAEPNYLFKWYVYIVAYLGIMLQASWYIPEGN